MALFSAVDAGAPWRDCGLIVVMLALLVIGPPASYALLNITSVSTPSELQAAAEAGAANIVVIEHLDFSEVEAPPPQEDGPDGWFQSVINITAGVSSITGNCAEPPATALVGDWKPGQCLLTFTDSSGFIKDEPSTEMLWLDNLYLLMAEPVNPNFLEHRVALLSFLPEAVSPFYITDVTVEGVHSSVLYDGAAVIAGQSVLASGLEVYNFGPNKVSPILFSNQDKSDYRANATASLIDCIFTGNSAALADCTTGSWKKCWEGVISTKYDIRLQNITFDNNTASVGSPGNYDVGVFAEGARVFADEVIVFDDTGDENQSLPLAAADTQNFLSLEDPAFQNLRAQVEEALLAAGTLAPAPSPGSVAVEAGGESPLEDPSSHARGITTVGLMYVVAAVSVSALFW